VVTREAEVAGFLKSHLVHGQFRGSNALRRAIDKHASRKVILHFQHEYGIYGRKVPPFYFFPRLIRELNRSYPREQKICATAHTVLGDEYVYPKKGRGWQAPFRGFANKFLMSSFRTIWNEQTWGPLDGVIVH